MLVFWRWKVIPLRERRGSFQQWSRGRLWVKRSGRGIHMGRGVRLPMCYGWWGDPRWHMKSCWWMDSSLRCPMSECRSINPRGERVGLRQGKDSLIKGDMTGDVHAIWGGIEAFVGTFRGGVSKKDTWFRFRVQVCEMCRVLAMGSIDSQRCEA